MADNSRYVTFYGEIADGDSASPGKLLALRVSMRSGEIAPLELEEREAPTVRSPGVAPRSPRPSTPRVMAPRSDRVVRTLRNLFGLVVEAIGKEGPHG